MSYFIYFLTILNFISLGLLIYTTYKSPHSYRRISIKIVSSLLFIFLGSTSLYISYAQSSSLPSYSIYTFSGLIFAALGDAFLGFADLHTLENNKLFILGVFSFSITHILFTFGFFSLNLTFIPLLLLLPCIVTLLFIFATPKKYFNFFGMKLYVIFYALIISSMLIACLSNLLPLDSPFQYLILIGTLLFIISDIILFFSYFFIKKNKLLTSFNLLTYYTAEILLALSLFIYTS